MDYVIMVTLLTTTLICSAAAFTLQYQQQTYAIGIVEREQIGDFQKLTGEFLQNPTSIQPSLDLMHSISFTRDFEIRIITAVLDDHVFEIPRIVEQYAESSVSKPIPGKMSWDSYFDRTLTIFCKQCTR